MDREKVFPLLIDKRSPNCVHQYCILHLGDHTKHETWHSEYIYVYIDLLKPVVSTFTNNEVFRHQLLLAMAQTFDCVTTKRIKE